MAGHIILKIIYMVNMLYVVDYASARLFKKSGTAKNIYLYQQDISNYEFD